MVNYQNGKVYRLDCLTTGKVYIGSTCHPTVAQRLAEHVSRFKKWKAGNKYYTSSFEVLEQENYKITLVELYPCDSKDELTSREGYFIRTTECVNKYIAGRTVKEYYEEHKKVILEQIAKRSKIPYTCPCGRTIRLGVKARHEKSAFHIKNIPII
jgi:hypothetical protein